MKVALAAPKSTIPPEQRVLVSEDDAATMLSMSKVTLRKLVAAGLIARVDLPGTRRNLYRIAELERYADSLALTTEIRARAAS